MNSRYFEYKAAGLCTRCGAPRMEGKTRCEKHHLEHLSYGHSFKEKAIQNGLCRYCCINPRVEGKSMCESCLDKHSERNREIYAKHRAACIEAYGGKCKCCGLGVHKYLQLDHINNDGAKHRQEVFNGTKGSIYTWAFRQKFPKILQLLCANCHQAKTTSGGCTDADHCAMKSV